MKKILFLCALLTLGGCVTTSVQKLNPSTYYKQDICFVYETGNMEEVKIRNFFKRFRNGRYRKTKLVREKAEFCGVGVLPYLDEYKIKVKAKGDLNFFALTTCHEETTSENPDSGWKRKDGEVSFTYKPTMERGKACPLYVSAYNRKQRHSWGIVAFEHPRYEMNATLSCNGYVEDYNGVSICQSREALIQKIEFDEPVKLVRPINGAADRKGPCPDIGEDGKKEYTFKIPERECVYGFIGRESGKLHQMYTIGYEEIPVRE